ncbi:hypothetical protein OAG76_00730 [Rubripirellula sp.]|nr:hypothetical protein [Rubripirellula sp.]MDB4633904.1 hypothetical protein [Rubripirellula sp.]MDC0288433.1 hypothetical protein [Rubripirellula sp.]
MSQRALESRKSVKSESIVATGTAGSLIRERTWLADKRRILPTNSMAMFTTAMRPTLALIPDACNRAEVDPAEIDPAGLLRTNTRSPSASFTV